MANFEFFYNDLTEKQTIINTQIGLGQRKIFDSFLEDNGAGGTQPIVNPDGTKGQLTFTDDPEPAPPPKDQKTTEVFANDQAEGNNVIITDSADVLGASSYAEISNLTPGPQQTGIINTYTKIDQFDTIGVTKNVTVSGPNNNLTILNAGFYSIAYSLSWTGTANETYVIAIHQNDTEIVKSVIVRKIGSGGDVGNASSFAIMQLAANDVIDLRVRVVSVGPDDFTLHAGNFLINKVR